MIRGKVIFTGQRAEGVSKAGKAWKKQQFVIETEGQYPKKVAFFLMNDKLEAANLQMGNTVEVEVDAQSREYNGKWYTELTAWRVNNIGNIAPQYAQPMQNQSVYHQTAPQGYAPTQTAQPVNPFGPTNSDEMPF